MPIDHRSVAAREAFAVLIKHPRYCGQIVADLARCISGECHLGPRTGWDHDHEGVVGRMILTRRADVHATLTIEVEVSVSFEGIWHFEVHACRLFLSEGTRRDHVHLGDLEPPLTAAEVDHIDDYARQGIAYVHGLREVAQ